MNIENLVEAFTYNLTPEDMEKEPVIFMILQHPLDFGRIFLDEIKKEFEVGRYEERKFIDDLKEILEKGPGHLTSFQPGGLTLNFDKIHPSVSMVLQGIKLIV